MTQQYALVGPDDTIDRIASDIDPKTGTKPGWRWLPYEVVGAVCDGATQVREQPSVDVLEGKVVAREKVRDKTAKEIAADEARKRDAMIAACLRNPLAPVCRRLLSEIRGQEFGEQAWRDFIEDVV